MQYSEIQADQVWGPIIGEAYMKASPFVTPIAKIAYAQFADQVEAQFRLLSASVDVEFVDHDPYTGEHAAQEMMTDVWFLRRLQIMRTSDDQAHPLLTREQNNQFRAVHDFHGHYMTNRGFDRHGEEAAWVRHSQTFTGLARAAMTTETRGQSSAFVWINGGVEFPPQKAVLLPSWVSEIPRQWRDGS